MTRTEELAVSCEGLGYKFGDHAAVSDVDLHVHPGQIYGLLGPNGAGKTTLLRMLVTILKPASGSVSVFGVDTSRQPLSVRRLLGYVPQALSADSDLSGRENVALFARLFDVPRKERKKRVDDALSTMGLLEDADRRASEYSGGMVRRLELAQALVSAPRLLILDEPTVGLDPIARESVWKQVARLRDEQGMTVLLTTHYMEEADSLCDEIALMHKGRVQRTGSPQDLKAALGPDATLDEVFRHFAGAALGDSVEGGDFKSVRRARRTARRLG